MRRLSTELERFCEEARQRLEADYLKYPDTQPWRQSGMSGSLDRWTCLRKPVADCVDRDGAFLDLCCANGFLLQSVQQWTSERGVAITPYGVDISAKLIAKARDRLPQYQQNLFVGNCFTWKPPQCMDFVSYMSGLFPSREYEDDFVHFVLQHHLKPDGKLLIHCTGPKGRALENMKGFIPLDSLPMAGHRMGYDPVKDREVYVAIIVKETSGSAGRQNR